jgi:hypothetical protein
VDQALNIIGQAAHPDARDDLTEQAGGTRLAVGDRRRDVH